MQLLPDIEDEDELLTKYGWVVAINPLGQMIFGPVAGWVGNRLKSVRVVCLCCCVLYICGNVIYCLLSLFLEDNRYAMLLVARFIVGIASSNVAPLRSYIALATFESERTFHMSIAAGAQSMGFVAGPIMQASLNLITLAVFSSLRDLLSFTSCRLY